MSIKILPPNEDKKVFFEKSVKPLLIIAEENNAVDKWIFNINDDGEVNTSSVVFVSTHAKMIFVTENLYKTNQPPKPKPFVPEDMDKDILSGLPSDLAKNILSRLPKDYDEEYIKHRKRLHEQHQRMVSRFETTVRIQLKDGSFEEMLETWSAQILVYDISDSRFTETKVIIQGTKKVPNIEDLCQDLDIQSLSLTAKQSSFSKVSYQSVSSRWKMRKKD